MTHQSCAAAEAWLRAGLQPDQALLVGATQEVLLPAPGLAERIPVRPWPAMAAQSAASVAGFFTTTLVR